MIASFVSLSISSTSLVVLGQSVGESLSVSITWLYCDTGTTRWGAGGTGGEAGTGRHTEGRIHGGTDSRTHGGMDGG